MKEKILGYLMANQEWYFDRDNVLRSKEASKDEISFPSLVFETKILQEGSSGWWSTHRNLMLMQALTRHKINHILEVGAGNGGVANFLHSSGIEVVCLEPHITGARQIASQKILSICGFLEELNLPAESVESIGFFDVLEHIKNPQEVLAEAHRIMAKNSLIFVMVPAHQFLFSAFDRQIGHFRRYSKSALRSEMQEAGFEVLEIRFMFITLFPAVVFQRLLVWLTSHRKVKNSSLFAEKTSGALNPNKYLNSFLIRIISWERRIDIGRLLPGVSLMIVARRISPEKND